MANTTNYNWETPDDTDLVKDGAAAIRTLGNSIDTTTKNLNPETTTGDIAYRSATANTNTRLPIGSAGQVLTVAAGVPSWATPTTGDIEGVTAGTGISGGGTSGTVTITNSMATAIDAKGDLIVGTGADAFSRLAVGATNGMVLTVDSAEATGLKYATPAGSSGPTFQAQRTGDQGIAAGTWVKVQLGTENWDSDSCYDPTTNYRFTPNKAGYYQCNMNVRFGIDNGGQITAANFYFNGSTQLVYGWCNNTSGTTTSIIDGSGLIYFNGSSDYLELYAFINTGTTRNVNGLTFMDAVWIRS